MIEIDLADLVSGADAHSCCLGLERRVMSVLVGAKLGESGLTDEIWSEKMIGQELIAEGVNRSYIYRTKLVSVDL